jgi:hypothetical protein
MSTSTMSTSSSTKATCGPLARCRRCRQELPDFSPDAVTMKLYCGQWRQDDTEDAWVLLAGRPLEEGWPLADDIHDVAKRFAAEATGE